MTETQRTPKEIYQEELRSVESNFKDLQSKALLSSARDRIEDIHSRANNMNQVARDIREKGYLYEKNLEDRCTDLRKQWAVLRPRINRELDTKSRELTNSMKQVENDMRRARASERSPSSGLAELKQAKASVQSLENKADAIQENILGMFDELENELNGLKSHLDVIDWSMDQVAGSTYELLSQEGAIRAVAAKWVRNKKDEPEGILILTDQRILFERKEEVTTKKVLFIATEKELIHEPMLDFPVRSVEKLEAKNEGFMKHEDHIHLSLSSDAPFSRVQFHIDGQPSDDWVRLIRRAKAGEFDDQRIEPVSEAEEERVRNAPTSCEDCGAAFTAPLLRGQTEIACEYCGSITRV